MNEHKGVCRTSPATRGLSNLVCCICHFKSQKSIIGLYVTALLLNWLILPMVELHWEESVCSLGSGLVMTNKEVL